MNRCPKMTIEDSKERRVVFSGAFVAAIKALPEAQKSACLKFSSLFRMGRAYRLDAAAPNLEYRVVKLEDVQVLVYEIEGYFILCFAGSSENVAQWAERWQIVKNPETNALQIFERRLNSLPEQNHAENTPSGPKLLDGFTNEELLAMGVPEARLALVRGIADGKALEAVQHQLPTRLYEALMWLAQGESKEDVLKLLQDEDTADDSGGGGAKDASQATDAEPKALQLDPGLFHIVTSDEDLRDILEKPLSLWRIYLHPSQKAIVEKHWRGAVRVTGGAGTGKTVVAMHRVKHLLELPDWKTSDKVLFTTFTKNLALDIEQQLSMLLPKSAMRRVTVKNLDAWLANYLKQTGETRRLVYPGGADGVYSEAWAQAMTKRPTEPDYAESFYRSEWESVVAPQHCETLRDYLFASRTGRGTALTRAERRAVWPVFEEMRLQLALRGAMTVEDAAKHAADLLPKTHPEGAFRAVVADEIQDFKPDMLRLLRAMTPDRSKSEPFVEGDLFLVGDAHQRIYGDPVAFSSCGIEIRGRSRRLRVNYRTTDEIRKAAEVVFSGRAVDDMEGADDAKLGWASLTHGAAPKLHEAPNREAEADWIAAEVRRIQAAGAHRLQDIVVAARTRQGLEGVIEAMKREGIPFEMISRMSADNPDAPGVRLATIHRIKGLEFKVVFVAGLEDGNCPLPVPENADAAERKLHEARERALFYVAASRAASVLYLSCGGKPGIFFEAAADSADGKTAGD